MFTGIVQACGEVLHFETTGQQARLVIENAFHAPLSLGESIAVNGTCLTVTESDPKSCLFFLSPETLAKTNLGALRAGMKVNLERALAAGERLSGHIVQGHVDGIGRVLSVSALDESHILEVALPAGLERYAVAKGSIALNGVSLTINSIHAESVSIMLIPHTWENTNLSGLRAGDPVNVEVDVIAKHVEKLCHPYMKPSSI